MWTKFLERAEPAPVCYKSNQSRNGQWVWGVVNASVQQDRSLVCLKETVVRPLLVEVFFVRKLGLGSDPGPFSV